MKKKLLILACALVLLVSCVAFSAAADTGHTAYCEYCQTDDVVWEPIVFGTHSLAAGENSAHKHFYFDKDYTHSKNQQLLTKGNVTVCVDLNGHSWYSYGRAFYANYTTKNADWSTINIQDSKGGAVVTSRAETTGYNSEGKLTGTNNTGGANIWVAEKCTVNIYGGTFKLDAIRSEYGLRVDNGGIASVCAGSTLNLYGGLLQGGDIKATGGAVYLYTGGALNAYGGVIKSGNSANGTGGAVGLQKTTAAGTHKVTLGGDAQVDEIYFPALRTDALTIDGAFTGKANLTYPSGASLAAGTVVGTLKNNGSIVDADLYCTNGSGYSVTADGTNLTLAAPSTTEVRYNCPHCQVSVKWEVFTTTPPSAAGTYHYYLSKDYGTSAAKQYTVANGAQVCIDLQGHSYDTIGRAFGTTSNANGTLSIIDTVGGGRVSAVAAGNNPGGGTISVGTATTFNLYGGTLSFTHDPTAKWGGTGRGGVIQSSGTLNIYGGKIIGGEVVDCTYEFTGIEGAGGAIYASSALNILGGEITSGKAPESGAGPCIYIAGTSTKVTLGGDAKVEEIYFSGLNPEQLTVPEDYTGSANLVYAPAVVLAEQTQVGTVDSGADMSAANITCGSYFVLPAEGRLVLSSYPAGTVAATGGVGYTNAQEAIDAAEKGATVELLMDVTGDLAVSKDICLQLNGCTVSGTVTVAEDATLYGMDSATADYTVADGKYGKLTKVVGTVAGAAAGSDNYLMLKESGGVSFHCVTLQIYAMTLRLDANGEPGLFYKSHFKADEKIAPTIESYGVALSVVETPNAENLDWACSYTQFEGFESGALGNLGNASSTLLTGILKERYTEKVNLQNVTLPIYGRAYAKTTDGQLVFGAPVCRSLEEQLQGIDQLLPTMSANQVSVVTELYTKFKPILGQFDLPGIAEAVQTQEEGTLKVLVVGNSHGLDATNLLYEVFHNEAPDQKVIIAALYYSGCNMDQHHDFLTNNKKVYTYHKNDGTQPDRTWVVKDSTCLDALQDEQWDYIFMQQMNHRVAIESNYDNSWKVVADYLLNNQDIAPKLGFHMTWTNPDDYALYLEDDAPLNNPSPASWRNSHEKYWSTDGKYDQSKQYLGIVECVQKYLVDDTTLLGRPYDLILPVATAIEYAQDVCGRTQPEIYRDYTHMNDYGRLITAYLWYAEIMELEELTEVNTDAIPAVLKHKNSKFPEANADGIYEITADMKQDLIASVNWALKNPFNLPE